MENVNVDNVNLSSKNHESCILFVAATDRVHSEEGVALLTAGGTKLVHVGHCLAQRAWRLRAFCCALMMTMLLFTAQLMSVAHPPVIVGWVGQPLVALYLVTAKAQITNLPMQSTVSFPQVSLDGAQELHAVHQHWFSQDPQVRLLHHTGDYITNLLLGVGWFLRYFGIIRLTNLIFYQNILFRYGHKHNLHFALPNKGNHLGNGKWRFKAKMVHSSPLNKLGPNILALHTKWNHDEVSEAASQYY